MCTSLNTISESISLPAKPDGGGAGGRRVRAYGSQPYESCQMCLHLLAAFRATRSSVGPCFLQRQGAAAPLEVPGGGQEAPGDTAVRWALAACARAVGSVAGGAAAGHQGGQCGGGGGAGDRWAAERGTCTVAGKGATHSSARWWGWKCVAPYHCCGPGRRCACGGKKGSWGSLTQPTVLCLMGLGPRSLLLLVAHAVACLTQAAIPSRPLSRRRLGLEWQEGDETAGVEKVAGSCTCQGRMD